MKLLIRIQSFSDLITNSSSTVFLCKNKTDMTIEQLKEFIYDYHDRHEYQGSWEDLCKMSECEKEQFDLASGTGGFLDVCSFKECADDIGRNYYFEGIKSPESYLLVDTDWGHRATINWLVENLNAKCVD